MSLRPFPLPSRSLGLEARQPAHVCHSLPGRAGGYFLLCILFLLTLGPVNNPARAQTAAGERSSQTSTVTAARGAKPWPAVTAAAGVLVEAASGQVLWQKNAFQPRPPASTTKIVTAILATELAGREETVTTSEMAASLGGSSIYLRTGEKLTVAEMLRGALLKSGNDAAQALAEHMAGSTQFFAWLMNQKTRLNGGLGSNFINPHGLPHPAHRATAYDLATVARYALQDPFFAGVVRTRQDTIPWPGYQWPRVLKNTNQLLGSYPGADGVKTGTTNEAGQCLVASATRDGRQLIAVVLASHDRYGDAARLLDYGFNSLTLYRRPPASVAREVAVKGGRREGVSMANSLPLFYTVPPDAGSQVEWYYHLPPEITAPVTRGKVLGWVEVVWEGRPLDYSPLAATADVPRKWWP